LEISKALQQAQGRAYVGWLVYYITHFKKRLEWLRIIRLWCIRFFLWIWYIQYTV